MQTATKVTVIINEKRHQFDHSKLCPDEIRRAAGLDFDYEVWLVVGRPDPEGQLPKDDVQVKDCIEVKDGTRFKVVPPGTFGAPQGASLLDAEVEELRALGFDVEVVSDVAGRALVFRKFVLPPGYTQTKTDLLIRIPENYPHAHPDMFFVETGVLLEGGRVPRNADNIESHGGKQWRRFSWHLNGRWHPGRDSFTTFVGFVGVRLAKRE